MMRGLLAYPSIYYYRWADGRPRIINYGLGIFPQFFESIKDRYTFSWLVCGIELVIHSKIRSF
jgi:hypothetical protein